MRHSAASFVLLILATGCGPLAAQTFESRSERTINQAERMSAAQPLTSSECSTLGGETKETGISVCSSGEYCRRTGQNGEVFRVCITKNAPTASSGPSATRPSARPGRASGFNSARPAGMMKAVPLTTQECTGLGGKVRPTSECGGSSTCVTADQHGVIRIACIAAK